MKARYKTILLSALGAFTVFTAVTFSSCKEDKCKAIVCAYGGVCTDGTCLCPSGYEGPQCETITRERYLGPWIVTEDGSLSNAAQYTVSVERGDNITELKLKNFRNRFLTDVSAFVKGDTLYIPEQTIDKNDAMGTWSEVRGTGYITEDKYYGKNGKLVIRYVVEDQAGNIDDFGIDSGDPSLWNK